MAIGAHLPLLDLDGLRVSIRARNVRNHRRENGDRNAIVEGPLDCGVGPWQEASLSRFSISCRTSNIKQVIMIFLLPNNPTRQANRPER